MFKKIVGFIGGMALIVLATNSWAWNWKRATDEDTPPETKAVSDRVLHKTLNAADGNTFVLLVKEKKALAQDVAVLNKMAQGLKSDFQAVTSALQKDFNILPAGNYNFDAGSNIIYEVQSKGAGTTGAVTKIHQRLETPQKINQFVGLVRAKRQIQEALLGLRAAIQYKKSQWSKIQAVLGAKFEIEPTRNYEFDSKTLSLYVVGAPPEEQIMLDTDEGESSDISNAANE